MPDQKLRALMGEIQTELTRAEGMNEGTRESLRRLVNDLEALLDRPADSRAQDDESLRSRLAAWVRYLEASHPALSTTLGKVIDTLAFFGL